jgi:hypothetical protein
MNDPNLPKNNLLENDKLKQNPIENLKPNLFLRLEFLSNEIKSKNNLKESKYRFDATGYSGDLDIVKLLLNPKGMFYLNLIPNDGRIKPNPPFKAKYFMNDRFSNNFSSLYYFGNSHTFTPCFGNPNTNKEIKGKPNPMYEFRDALYLFDLSVDNVIDLYIFKNKRNEPAKYLELFDRIKEQMQNEKLKRVFDYKM